MGEAVAQRIDDARLPPRRTIDEQLLVLLPSLFAPLARMVLARPVTSRVRQALIRRSLVSGWAANNRGDFRLLRTRYAADIIYEMTPELVTLGARPRSRGTAEFLATIEDFLDSWAEWRFIPAFFIATDRRVISLGRFIARGRTSHIETEIDIAQVMDLDRGVVAHERDFADWSQALTVGGFDPKVLGRLEALAPGESLEL